MNNKLFLDINVLQTVPPSNINRDDTGSPKTAQYGGVARSRVSSQSWKKAIRTYFNENGDVKNVGIRSLEIVQYLADEISKLVPEKPAEEVLKLADETLNNAGIKTKDYQMRALFFMGATQAEALARAAVDGVKDKKKLQALIKDNPAIDIALFGRMVADDPSLNEDASSQIAHAISTHAVQTEFDFFTATDDLAPEDNAGAGMLGTVEFNSSTLYRYGNVAIHDLLRQLGNEEVVVNALKLFIEAFVNSMPTGKVNTFANQTLPHAVLVTVRSDRPVNLVGGFEAPVKAKDGYIEQSISALREEFTRVRKFVKQPEFTLTLGLDSVGIEQDSLNALVENFADELSTILQ